MPRFFNFGLGLARMTGFSGMGIWLGEKTHLSSMSTELVATIILMTSGGGGADGLGGGVFFFVRFLAPFSSDFLSELFFSELFSVFRSVFLLDLVSRMIGGKASSSSEIGRELTDSVDEDEEESRRDRTLADAIFPAFVCVTYLAKNPKTLLRHLKFSEYRFERRFCLKEGLLGCDNARVEQQQVSENLMILVPTNRTLKAAETLWDQK